MIASRQFAALLGATLFATLCSAKEKTNVFVYEPDAKPFEHEELEGSSLVGVIIGIGLLGIFILTTIVIIIKDEIQRHADYKQKRDQIKKECLDKGYNFDEADKRTEYKAWKKAKIL